jgi:hypothetical protein
MLKSMFSDQLRKQPTMYSGILHETVTVAQLHLLRILRLFTPSSQEPVTGLYPEPDVSSPPTSHSVYQSK